jgi:cell division protein FtsI/penicillin-binding protein 2
MQMGGGELNRQGRDKWYDYMVNHYLFGKSTGIEQPGENDGYIPRPENNGAGINLTYANTAFGQAMTANVVQMGAALSAVLNGGTYYQPHLVEQYTAPNGSVATQKPKIVKTNVVSAQVGKDLIPLLEYVVNKHSFSPKFDQNTYAVGGKTGTAQIAKPTGGYEDDEYNGTYMGFVGGDHPQYVIVVFVNKPKIGGYAGSMAAQPIFGDLAHMLIDDYGVTPKTKN